MGEMEHEQETSKKLEIREPSRTVLVDWVVDWILATQPKDSTLVPAKEIEDLTGLKWDSKDLKFILMAAKRKLYHTTRYEWGLRENGIYMLSPSERKNELYRRERESLSRHREVIASAATIPVEELTSQERSEVEHARRVALHLYEEGKKSMRAKWIPSSSPPKGIEGNP